MQGKRFVPVASLGVAEFFGSLGVQVVLFVVPLAAIQFLQATAMQIAVLNLMESLGALIFGLTLSHWVDRRSGFWNVAVANVLRLTAAAGLTFALLWELNIVVLMAFVLLFGISLLINESGMSAALVESVGRDGASLNKANAWLRGATIVSDIGGPALGGVLVGVLSYSASAGASVPLFVIASGCAIAAWWLHARQSRGRHVVAAEVATPMETTEPPHGPWDGLGIIFRDTFLRKLTLTSMHFNFFSAIFQAVFLLFCVRILGMSTTAVAIIAVAGALGGMLAMWFVGKIAQERAARWYRWSITVPAASIALMVAAQWSESDVVRVLLVALAEVVFSFAMVVCIVLFNTARQQHSPDGYVGQVAASERVLALCLEIPGFLLGGSIATIVNLQWAMLLAAGGIVFSAWWMRGVHSQDFMVEAPATD